MSAERESRMAALQHRRRQQHRHEELVALAPKLAILPIESAESLDLIEASRAEIARLRETGKLRRERFATKEEAVRTFTKDLGDLERTGVWRFFGHERAGLEGDGFFAGQMESTLLLSWLSAGNDGFELVARDLTHGRLLDVVKDDPWEGSFVEVESW